MLRFICFFLFSILPLPFLWSQCNWGSLGVNIENQVSFNSPPSASQPNSLALSNKDIPYVAFLNKYNKVCVRKYENDSWSFVGQPEISLDEASDADIILDTTGAPWIVYNNKNNGYKAIVRKYDGANWNNVGNDSFSLGPVDHTTIAIDKDNDVFIAYKDIDSAQRVTVMKFDGANWILLGQRGFGIAPAENIILKIDKNGTPYVAFIEKKGGYKVRVMKFDGVNWINVGNTGYPIQLNSIYQPISFAIDGYDNPYLAYRDSVNGGGLTVRKYDGSNWNVLGSVNFLLTPITNISLCINSNNIPYVASSTDANNGKMRVDAFNGNTWTPIGINPISISYSGIPTIKINSKGMPIVLYKDNANNTKLLLAEYNGVNWINLGIWGVSDANSYYNSIAIEKNGTLYIAYLDGARQGKVTVKKFSNNAWSTVGDEGFSLGECTNASIAISKNGIPYVAYSQKNNDSLYVMMYDGFSWVFVGATNKKSTVGFGYYYPDIKIQLDSNNVPYVLYESGAKIALIKYNGTSWDYVGGSMLNANSFNSFRSSDLAIDMQTNTPYIAYTDSKNSDYGATVIKFNGLKWDTVGTPQFSYYYAMWLSLVINKMSEPLLAFEENVGGASVMKFKANKWDYVGPFEFSDGKIEYTSISLDKYDTPYVAYRDLANNSSATVLRYNGKDWEAVGQKGFSKSSILFTSMVVDTIGSAFLIGAESGAFVYNIYSPNTGIISKDSILTCVEDGASYQWIDCNSNSNIIGAVNKSLKISAPGNYAVIVTKNNCTDTSACVSMLTSVNDINKEPEFVIYPNPSNGYFTIRSNSGFINNISIFDILGNITFSDTDIATQVNFDFTNKAKGVYLVRIVVNNNVLIKKLLVQ